MSEETTPIEVEIVKRQSEGQNWTQIADGIGKSRRGLFNIRQGEGYMTLVSDTVSNLLPRLLEAIEKFSNDENKVYQIEAMKEMGRLLGRLLPSLAVNITKTTTEDIQATLNINITEKRKETDELIKRLNLTPEQLRELEDSVKVKRNPPRH